MTISNPTQLDDASGALAGQAVPLGTALPSEAELTQMANQLFHSMPCDGSRMSAFSNALNVESPGQQANALDPALIELAIPSGGDLQKKVHVDASNPTASANYYFLEMAESHARSLKTRDFGSLRTPLDLLGLNDSSFLTGSAAKEFNIVNSIDYEKLNTSRFDGSHIPHSASSNELPKTKPSYPDPVFADQKSPDLQKAEHFEGAQALGAAPVGSLDAAESHPHHLTSHEFSSAITPTTPPKFNDSGWLSGVTSQEYGSANSIDWLRLKTPRIEDIGGLPQFPSQPEFYFLKPPSTRQAEPHIPAFDGAHRAFDVNSVRRDFPILNERVNGHQLVWLDNAATTQKPKVVIDRLSYFYSHENSNIHRAAHELAARATDAYEKARDIVARFTNAPSSSDIVFVRGTTEAINLVAKTWGKQNIGKDDEIVITWLEHHANIVPWQQLCAETGAILKVAPVDDQGQVIFEEYQKLLNSHTKLVSFTQVSNALGTVTPAQAMIAAAHGVGAKVLLDAAQSVSHLRVDVQTLDCDWLVFSGHKIFGPTGIGALYGKAEVLESMPPWQGGGNMIEDVTFEHTKYQPAPAKFEAGTGNIADAVGLGAALEYVAKLGIDNIARYEHELLVYGMDALRRIPGLTLIGTAPDKTSVLSFVLAGHSTEDVGSALNRAGIAVRSGHHCAQPILRRYGLESTVRPSLAFYNTYDEIDYLAETIRRIKSGQHH